MNELLKGELDEVTGMLQHIGQSMEAQDLKVNEYKAETDAQIKAYDAETKRMAALSNAINPEQIQDMVLGTVHAMIASGELMAPVAAVPETPEPDPTGA